MKFAPKKKQNLFLQNKSISLFLLFLFLSLILMLFGNLGAVKFLRGGLEKLILPLKAEVYAIRRLGSQVVPKQDLESQMAALQAQISALKSENASMRRLLGSPLPSNWKFQPATVIGRYSSSGLQIDKGEKDGIKKGMAVVSENVLVGKVIWTGEHFSKILLPSSADSKILVVTRPFSTEPTPSVTPDPSLSVASTQVKAKGLLIGQGSKASLEQVLVQDSLVEGDLILTAGDQDLPPNLLIGKVGTVSKKEGDLYQKAEVDLLLNPNQLETVFTVSF